MYTYIYIYMLGSSAHLARTMAYRIMARDHITGLHHGMILWGYMTEVYYGTALQNHSMG